MDQRLEDLLNRDPVTEVELATGKRLNTPDVPFDRRLALQFLGHAADVNTQKRTALSERNDAHYATTLPEYQAIIADLGFRKLLEIPFVGRFAGSREARNELYFVYFRDNGGVLLSFDTFCGKSVNSGKFYYNWRRKPECLDVEVACKVTSSGGWDYESAAARCEIEPTRPPFADWELIDAGDEAAKGRRRAYDRAFAAHSIWAGDHDCREAIRHNIAKLEEFGVFVSPWVRRPWLWLVHHMDGKDGAGNEKPFDYKAITAERLALLPADVQTALTPIGPVSAGPGPP